MSDQIIKNMFGELVFINLSSREIRREICPDTLIKSFLGGRGLAISLLLKYLRQDVQALDAQNPLILATGLFTGTEMISSSRLHICTRSPLTGLIGSSNVGGDMAHELSLCGIGALIISGKAERPVSIKIHDRQISFHDASTLWGLTTTETSQRVRTLHQETQAKVLAIGPAGEQLCAFASIMTCLGHFAGRTGTGAVMGSKFLKAMTVRSSLRKRWEKNPQAVRLVKKYFQQTKMTQGYKNYSTIGSTGSTLWLDRAGANAVRNFQDVTFHAIDEVSYAARPDVIEQTKGCYKCPVKCKADVKLNGGRHHGVVLERPEFESMVAWGAKCGTVDGREVVYLHHLCDEYGIDSIEAGNLIAFVMDLFEKEILSSEEVGGLDLRWGNITVMETLLKEMVYQTSPFGAMLAKGINHAVQAIGNGAENHAFAVKGLTMTGMDPRGFKATALGYAVGARGSDFTQVYAKAEYKLTPEKALAEYGTEKAADRLAEDGKALMVRKCISSTALIDALGLCKIPQLGCLVDNAVNVLGELLHEIIGFSLSTQELFHIGERIINAERIFNYKFGATKHDDSLPAKFLTEAIPHGVSKGSVVNLELMLREYYALMGWDEHGAVTPEKCWELGLEGL